MEPVPDKQDRAKLIDQFVEEVGSRERFQEMIAERAGQDAFNAISDAISQASVKLRVDAWKSIMDRLYDSEFWQPLAQDPRAFNAELKKTLAQLRRLMKLVYGIKSQRPTKNAERDKKIYELRQQGRSFGEIGIDLHIPDKVAERAYKRHKEKQKADLRAEVTFLTDLFEQAMAQSQQPSKPESSSTPT